VSRWKIPHINDGPSTMSNYKTKLYKTISSNPSVVEETVAQAIYELGNNGELKDQLKDLYVANAKEIETVSKGKKKNVILVQVPQPSLRLVHRLHSKLIPDLEKRLKSTVLITAKRTIESKWVKTHKSQQRPRNRTLKTVYDNLLEDLCLPAAIIGRRFRHRLDGSVITKIYLDQNEEAAVKDKVETITALYKQLTTREIQIEFKPEWHFYTLKK